MGCSFLLMSSVLLAAEDVSNLDEQKVRLVMTKDTGVELQVETKQAPLAQVLNAIANKTGVSINYTVLPEELVTATCVGTTVKQVMECLFEGKADLIFRYSPQSSKSESQGQPAEVWVLGTKFAENFEACTPAETRQQTFQKAANAKTNPDQAEPEPDETDKLVKKASSKVPAERAEAVGRLLAEGRKNDLTVREALEAGLSDKDAKVRAQALSSLAHREGAGAATALQEAIHDNDVSVRLTAVDNAGDDVALLQQALNDEDASVRELAALRLGPISKMGTAQ
jgi:hypothetical protein